MVNRDLIKYLAEGKRRGFSVNILKSKLLGAGFKEQDVNEAVNFLDNRGIIQQPEQAKLSNFEQKPQTILSATNKQNAQAEAKTILPSGKLGIFKKIGMSITHPSELFEKTKGERIGSALKYLMITLIAPFVVVSLMTMLFVNLFFSAVGNFIEGMGGATVSWISGADATMSVLLVLMLGLILFIGFPITSFISAGILHLFVKLYKGNGSFKETFGASVYSSTPQTLFFFLFPVASIWSSILLIFGISIRHNLSKGKALLAVLTPAILLFILWIIIVLILVKVI